jgi:hypothetical protein
MRQFRKDAVQMVAGSMGFILLGVAAMSGCVNKTFVQGGDPTHELATVTADLGASSAESDPNDRTLTFTNLDGERLTSYWLIGAPTELQVTPGRHVLWVLYRHKTLVIEPKFVVDLKAGSNYLLHEGLEGGAPQFWLTQAGSNERIPMDLLRR